MKISQQELNQIIREEVYKALKEVDEEDPTKPQGRKGLEKQEVPDPKVKAKKQKVKLLKRTAAEKKKGRDDTRKSVASDGKYAKAIEKERARKAAKKKRAGEKASKRKVAARTSSDADDDLLGMEDVPVATAAQVAAYEKRKAKKSKKT